MPIELPNLDDRSFADLVEEARQMIPGIAPAWTDHNPSDPGITIVELFAWFSEMLMYRINRVSEPNKRAFIQLLTPDAKPTPGLTIDEEVAAAVRRVRTEDRAVTAGDFERLALQVPGVALARCLARRNLEVRGGATADAVGHISLLVLCQPRRPVDATAGILASVKAALADACLIATRLHVVEPVPLTLAVKLTLRIAADQLKNVVQQRAMSALQAFFDPLSGRPASGGWPFGVPIYRSDVYALLDQVEGVDYVEVKPATDDLTVVGPAGVGDRRITLGPNYVGLRLESNEVAVLSPDQSKIVCLSAGDISN
jgi:hypothetical protein